LNLANLLDDAYENDQHIKKFVNGKEKFYVDTFVHPTISAQNESVMQKGGKILI
jgi:hypothetical protein